MSKATGLRSVRYLILLAVAGCGASEPKPLDQGPGQHVVLGRIDLSGFEVTEGIVDIVREDQTFWQEVRTGLGAREFAVALPTGRYRVTREIGGKRDGFLDGGAHGGLLQCAV